MKNEKLTLLIISEKTEKTQKFQLYYRNLIISVLLIFIIMIGGIFGIYSSYKMNIKLLLIKQDHDKMLLERNKVINMTRDLNRISEMDIYVRNSIGIPNYISHDSLLNNISDQIIPVSYIENSPSFLPVSGFVSQSFITKSDNKLNDHSGLDIVASFKTPFHSTADGIVIYSGWKHPYGNTIIIYHGDDYFSLYGHNFENIVFEKEKIVRGQIIGLIGDSGETTGPHLHFEIWKNGEPINPSLFIAEYRLENLSFGYDEKR